MDIDNHADTCVVGCNCHIFQTFDRHVDVTGYDPGKGKESDVDVVSAAIAYDHPLTGEVFILIIHQAISIPSLVNNLLCPFQLRMNDVKANECPKMLAQNPTIDTYAISIQVNELELVIPSMFNGVTSMFYTRKPSTC